LGQLGVRQGGWGGVRDLSVLIHLWAELRDEARVCICSALVLCPAGLSERLGGRLAVSWAELIS